MGALGRTALVAGATGLVGRACLARLLDDARVERVVALVRQPRLAPHPKLRVEIVDLGAPPHTLPDVPCDDVYCALGTTLARAGSQDGFRAVDLHAVRAVAEIGLRGGATRMAAVSSVGADRPGRNFYLGVKADAEAMLAALPFERLHILRPGLLLGPRDDVRPAEALAQRAAPAFNLLLPGPLRRYRAIDAVEVGRAMVGAVLHGPPGRHVLHYDDIRRAAAIPSAD